MIFDKLLKNEKGESINIFDVFLGKNNSQNYIYTLAEAHAIDLIAKTIAKCEIQVFEKDKKTDEIKESKNNLYWRLNLQPNYNENGTMFLYKLMTKLLINQRVLIIINQISEYSKLLYIADDFKANSSILYSKIFSDITISDNEGNVLSLNKTYNSENAIYYSLKNTNLAVASENFKENTAKILKAAQKSFIKANTGVWRLGTPGSQYKMIDAETKKPIDYSEYTEKITNGLFSEEDAVVMLSQMFNLENLNKDNNKNSTDLENSIIRIGNSVAQKWNIPTDVFWGNKTEKSTGNDDFITFGVDPYFELIEDGLNIGLVGKSSFLEGEYVAFNRTNINHKDVLDSSTGIDKLTGAKFSRNEINKLLRLPRIDKKWADEHNLTKNYGNVEGGAE